MPTLPTYWKVLTRRKILKNEAEEEIKLNRVLGLFDLTALGVGSTLGAGVYVLAGQIAKDQAGPSVMISFAIAALASALAGVCYAEFGARVPKAGSAYIYSYVCIGEFVAFVIGWNLILEYIIGTAGVCRSISLYLDTLLNDTLKTAFADVAPIQWNFFGGYFDFLAFALAVVFGVATAFGVETSTMLNNFCTLLNISVLLFVIIAGAIKADISNWQVDSSTNITANEYNIGKGGYFPFGFEGTLKGAATCFFGFVGFDCIATTGEEVRNPQKNIPRSILYSLIIIFLCYFGVSTVLTLMVPYYVQDTNAPLPFAFKEIGWNFAMWIVTIGGLVGLLASLFGALFPIPRIIYSMAEDGLLFRFLGKVSPRFKTPVTGSVCAALLTGIIAGIFDLSQLVNLLSIGTLLAYTVVAISITILRFMDSDGETRGDSHLSENSMLTSNGTKITFKAVFQQLFNFHRLTTPNYLSTKIVGSLILFFCIISLSCGLLIMNASEAIITHESWALALLSILIASMVILITAIWMQPKELYTSIFRVPLVPLVPAISIFINIYLMLQLDVITWIRFGFWMLIGLPLFIFCYCTYDKSNKQFKNRRQLFMDALKIFDNDRDQLELVENGVCNNSVKILVPGAPEINNKRITDIIEPHESPLDEITIASHLVESRKPDVLDNNHSLNKNQLTFMQVEQYNEELYRIVTIEDENSVIAMLDGVLENEDDDLNTPSNIQQSCSDSKIPENSVKTKTVASIHNTGEPSLNELNKVSRSKSTLHPNIISYTEVWQLAFNLVNEIFGCDELMLAIEGKRKLNDETQELKKLWNPDLGHSRNNSESSDISHDYSNEDPIHSDNFKSKLSLLIVQPPWVNRLKKKENRSSVNADFSQELKPSKSETDIHNMALRAIDSESIAENTGTSKKSPADIPTPPKFDPVLYRTVGRISTAGIRNRPNIDKLILNKPIDIPRESLEEELPFKEKLEALLKRGPSHRMQKQSAFIATQRPSSVGKSKKAVQQNILQPITSHTTLSSMPTASLKGTSSDTDTKLIHEIRKKLRHVDVINSK